MQVLSIVAARLRALLNRKFAACAAIAALAVIAFALLEPQEAGAQAPYDIGQMGRECTQKIGVIKPFSCLDGEIIPITVNGRAVAPGEASPMLCDRPSLLAPAYCKPFARVGRLEALGPTGAPDPDVQNVFICRRYNEVSDPMNPEFKDVAIIQHRKSTGATCFFQHLDDFANATRVPPPNEPAAQTPAGRPQAATFWLSPARSAAINCVKCHDAGPFIHTPYIDQVRVTTPNGPEPIAHPFPRLRDGQKNNYRFVGQPFQSWGIPEFILPTNNKCTECHVLGTRTSSAMYTRFATGRAHPDQATELFKRYPNSHWMAPEQAQEMPEEIFERLYGESISQILACSSEGTMASAPECKRQPFGPN